ncbi:hypothetical protein [Marinobacterium jannaschii]|uniref:hypothetical protein n=1 Tax=Marinobacterium jannaschii TaxID=64970 RepID=UPI0012EBA0F9|nr:hypothetical protein [Marinobacterium jannaschii]
MLLSGESLHRCIANKRAGLAVCIYIDPFHKRGAGTELISRKWVADATLVHNQCMVFRSGSTGYHFVMSGICVGKALELGTEDVLQTINHIVNQTPKNLFERTAVELLRKEVFIKARHVRAFRRCSSQIEYMSYVCF